MRREYQYIGDTSSLISVFLTWKKKSRFPAKSTHFVTGHPPSFPISVILGVCAYEGDKFMIYAGLGEPSLKSVGTSKEETSQWWTQDYRITASGTHFSAWYPMETRSVQTVGSATFRVPGSVGFGNAVGPRGDVWEFPPGIHTGLLGPTLTGASTPCPPLCNGHNCINFTGML